MQVIFIIRVIPLIAMGQLVWWVKGRKDTTTTWHPIQFVIRYAQASYCGYVLIDSSDPEIRAALQMENYFAVCLLDQCVTKLMGHKSLTLLHADQSTSGRKPLREHGVFLQDKLQDWPRTVQLLRDRFKEEREIFAVHLRSWCILSTSVCILLIETSLF